MMFNLLDRHDIMSGDTYRYRSRVVLFGFPFLNFEFSHLVSAAFVAKRQKRFEPAQDHRRGATPQILFFKSSYHDTSVGRTHSFLL